MESSSKIAFHFRQPAPQLRNRLALKKFIPSIFKREDKPLQSLDYIFCSDPELLEINRRFLHHDFYTDIVTFDLSDADEVIGEIYISLDRVKDNYKQFGSSFKEELHRVIFHGALHLCGFKDKRRQDIKLMREKENEYLKRYFKQ